MTETNIVYCLLKRTEIPFGRKNISTLKQYDLCFPLRKRFSLLHTSRWSGNHLKCHTSRVTRKLIVMESSVVHN